MNLPDPTDLYLTTRDDLRRVRAERDALEAAMRRALQLLRDGRTGDAEAQLASALGQLLKEAR